MGTVPLHPNPKKQEDKKQWEIVFEKLTSPNDDPDLQGAEFWVEKNSAVRYFVIGNRKWYRIGDFLSLKMIIAPIVAMKKTGEYVTCWHCACQHSVNLQRLKNLGKDLGDKAERRHQLRNKTFPKANQVLSTADEGSRVLLNVYQAFCIVGPPMNPLRSSWEQWNVAENKFEGNYQESVRRERRKKLKVLLHSTTYQKRMKDCTWQIYADCNTS